MSKKLTVITPQYHSFVPDQVLTDKDLNEVINYFEDQTRLTRVCLSGVGVACGFKVNVDDITTPSEIYITQGAGVTTDGDLFHLLGTDTDGNPIIDIDNGSITYNAFATYNNSDHPYQPQFWFDNGGVDQQLDLIELIPSGLTVPSTPIAGSSLDLTNKTVLLYLECYENEPGVCSSQTCDNQGAEQVQKLRVLLINNSQLDLLNETDSLFNMSNVAADYLTLECISAPRVILNENNTDELINLAQDYNTATSNLDNLTVLQDGFQLMLSHIGLTSENSDIQAGITAQFTGSFSNSLFQYRYDLYKDVMESYNELKDLYFKHYAACCPDIESFPKHLLLGKINGPGEDPTPEENPNRHPFYKSPILDCGEDIQGLFKAIVDRVVLSFDTYEEIISAEDSIIITPSNLRKPIGQRALPFYYKTSLTDNGLIKIWDFDKINYKRYEYILGYQQSQFSTKNTVTNPLGYNIDPYDFFRIEGHQGWQYAEALEEINNLKENNSLPFDVKILGIDIDESADVNVEDYACDFDDLGVLLDAWSAEQECAVGEVSFIMSGFSTVNEAVNDNELEAISIPPDKDPGYPIVYETSPVQDPCNPNVFIKDNAVTDNYTKEKDTVGEIFEKALVKYSGTDSTRLYAFYQDEAEKIPFGTWQDNSVNSTISLPGKILSACYALTQLVPDSIQNLDNESLINYTNEINKLCTYTKQLQSAYKDTTLKVSLNISGMMDLLSNQLASICCGAQKLQTLFQEVIDRKLEVLTRLKFSIFAEQHPGLEHQAGVPTGGTFVMVYVFSAPSSNAQTTSSIPSGTVVADFALPYLCCSDCAPINFIVPKPVVSLSLPTNEFCLGDEPGVFIFTVEPGDGTIETVGAIPGATIIGTELTIDPATFLDSNFNIPIGFTVNSQVTNVFMTVRKQPVVNFTTTIVNNVVTFIPNGDLSNSDFVWDFGDGTTSTAYQPQHTYILPVPQQTAETQGDVVQVPVTLTVIPNSGGCTATVANDVQLPVVKVSIEQNTFCLDDDKFPFTITPDYADPIIEGIGVEGKFFNPALTIGQTGPFDMKFLGVVFDTITIGTIFVDQILGSYYETGLQVAVKLGGKPNAALMEFFDAETDQKILEDIKEIRTSIEFSSVPNPTNLKIRFTASYPCGHAVSESVYRMPPFSRDTALDGTPVVNDDGSVNATASRTAAEVAVELEKQMSEASIEYQGADTTVDPNA